MSGSQCHSQGWALLWTRTACHSGQQTPEWECYACEPVPCKEKHVGAWLGMDPAYAYAEFDQTNAPTAEL